MRKKYKIKDWKEIFKLKWSEEIMWEGMKTTQNVNIYHMRETIMFITTALVRFSTRVSQLSTWNFSWNLSFFFVPVYFFHFLLCFYFIRKWKLVHICKSFFYHKPRFFHHFFFLSILIFLLCFIFCYSHSSCLYSVVRLYFVYYAYIFILFSSVIFLILWKF